MKQPHNETIVLSKIVGGGQAMGVLESGKKVFVWGGLPDETVEVQITKSKSKLAEGIVTDVVTPSPERITPIDPESYMSTSPWQIMNFDAEQHYKSALIEEAFELHDIVLPDSIDIFTNGNIDHYRNKVEFSWWGDTDSDGNETLDLAFFRRGTSGKIPVEGTSLAHHAINMLAQAIRDHLRANGVSARRLKTLLIRSNQQGECVWQLYAKDKHIAGAIDTATALSFPAQGGEVIYSDPKSPASRITERLTSFGDVVLKDSILDIPFRYACEGFFQVNIPVYEQALKDMQNWVNGRRFTDNGIDDYLQPELSPLQARGKHGAKPGDDGDSRETVTPQEVIDLYSGVGSIGLTIGGDGVTLVEISEDAVREMRENVARLNKKAEVVLAPSEKALDYITSDKIIIVDPPRAGLHPAVIERLLETVPERIIYLSCNPVTQARDVALLAGKYGIAYHRGYNFFPRTPHIEHLVVLTKV